MKHITRSWKTYVRWSWFSVSYFNLIEVSIGCQVWISFSPFDTHERKLSAPYSVSQSVSQSGDREVGRRHTLRSCLPPVWKQRAWDGVHCQDILRPEGHHAGGRLCGFQCVQGTCGPDRERGLALRHHHPGLQPAQPAAEQVPPSAGGPGFPLQPVRTSGKLGSKFKYGSYKWDRIR